MVTVYCCKLICSFLFCFIFFFKQKTAYEMRISDWSSDVCSSDLPLSIKPDLEGMPEKNGEMGLMLIGHQNGQAVAWAVDADEKAIEIGRASCRERVCQYV